MDLYEAAVEGNVARLKQIRKRRFSQRSVAHRCKSERRSTLFGRNMLHLACERGHDEMIEYLVTAGVNVSTKTKYFEKEVSASPYSGKVWYAENGLHLAIKNGHVESVRTLLRLTGDKLVNSTATLVKYGFLGPLSGTVFRHEFSPLHLACYAQSPDMVKLLCEKNVKVNAIESKNGCTPLLCVCESSKKSTVVAENGADEDSVVAVVAVDDGVQIVPDPAENGEIGESGVIKSTSASVQIVDTLAAAGANMSVCDKKGRNAVHLATMGFNAELLRHVVALGTNIHAVDTNGNTALHNLLVHYSEHELESIIEVASVLLLAGLDVNSRNNSGKTILHLCAENDLANLNGLVIELIHTYKADPSLGDNSGKSPLLLALQYQSLETRVSPYLFYFPDNIKNNHGNSNGADNNIAVPSSSSSPGRNGNDGGKRAARARSDRPHAQRKPARKSCFAPKNDTIGKNSRRQSLPSDSLMKSPAIAGAAAPSPAQANAPIEALNVSPITSSVTTIPQFTEPAKSDLGQSSTPSVAIEASSSSSSLPKIALTTSAEEHVSLATNAAPIAIKGDEEYRTRSEIKRSLSMPPPVDFKSPNMESNPAVHYIDEKGNTVLHYAAKNSRGAMCVRQIKLLGVDINATNAKGRTPLHVAAKKGHLITLENLLAHAADVNAVDVEGNTPLHVAVFRNAAHFVAKLLVDSGADLNIKNKAGKTPLDVMSPVVKHYIGVRE